MLHQPWHVFQTCNFPDTGVGVSLYITNLSDKQASNKKISLKKSSSFYRSGGGGVFETLNPPNTPCVHLQEL